MTLIQVQSDSKLRGLPTQIELSSTDHVSTLVAKVSQISGLSVHRVGLSISSEKHSSTTAGHKTENEVELTPTDPITNYTAGKGSVLVVNVSDLGPQVAWRTVYILEYLGPLIIHPVFYLLKRQIYGSEYAHSLDQQLVFALTMLHFIKREFESMFVHKFSVDTMHLYHLVKHCAHYWLVSGVVVAYVVYAPITYHQPSASLFQLALFTRLNWFPLSPPVLFGLVTLWAYGELSNLYAHVVLSNLRTGDSKKRKIPYGYGFNLVSCPHYFFEAVSFTAIALIAQHWSSAVFLVVGTTQMYIWAVKRHQRYHEQFPNYPKNRKAMFPFIA